MSNSDLHIVKTEIYDPDMMELICRDNRISKSVLRRLSSYRDKRSFGSEVIVTYFYGKGCENLKIGRLYAKYNCGLQSFPKDIRNSLIAKFYWDIDIENCHYNLMIKFGKEWNIPVSNIKYYCENRNKCLEELSSDRNVAKVAFLKIAYGGNIKLFDPDFVDDNKLPTGNLTLLKEVEKETNILIEECFKRYKDIYKDLLKGKPNKKTSCFAFFLQTEECFCLLSLDAFLKIKNRRADIFIHDGLDVRKLPNETVFPKELLSGGENYIFEKTGHQLKLVCKPFTNLYVPLSIPNNIVITDEFACQTFINLLKDNICFDNNKIYFFDETTGLWEQENQNVFLRYCSKFKNELTFESSSGSLVYYGSNFNNAKNMRNYLPALLPNSNHITKNIDTSIGKLLFNNGYYDFLTDTFYKTFDKNIIFLNKINRDFEDEDFNLTNEVNKILFQKPFENIDKKCCKNSFCSSGEYLKKVLCMAIFGDYQRKKCYFGTGMPNSGKGLICHAFKMCFEGYIDEFNPNNLCYSKNFVDEAKRLAWLKDFVGKRLVFSNEIRLDSNGFDGNLIKSVVSGGDTLKIRGNFENQINFINKATLFMLSNDIPTITPCDDAITLRCKCFKYNVSFVENPTEKYHRQADPSIKTKFSNDKYKNALFHLMIKTYKNLSPREKEIGGFIEEPKCVLIESKNRVINEKDTIKNLINERFIITNNDKDRIPAREIIDFINSMIDIKVSETTIGKCLSEMNVIVKNIKSIRFRCNIKIKDEIEDDK
jgi:hypothetical protein